MVSTAPGAARCIACLTFPSAAWTSPGKLDMYSSIVVKRSLSVICFSSLPSASLSSSRLVIEDHHARGVRLALHQSELHLVLDVLKERLAPAQDQRVQKDLVFIDQIQVGKGLHQTGAAIDHYVVPRLL